MKQDIREKLGNIETSCIKLKQAKTMLEFIENDYFKYNEVKFDDRDKILKLVWEYNRFQTLLFVSTDILYEQLKQLETNIYSLYDDLKEITDIQTKVGVANE